MGFIGFIRSHHKLIFEYIPIVLGAGALILGRGCIGGDSGESVETTPTVITVPATSAETPIVVVPTEGEPRPWVLVVNRSGISQYGDAVEWVIFSEGYTTLEPTDARQMVESMIYYRPSFADDARELMRSIAPSDPEVLAAMPPDGLEASFAVREKVATADVVVVLGGDNRIYSGWENFSDPALTSSGARATLSDSSTTTAAPTTTAGLPLRIEWVA